MSTVIPARLYKSLLVLAAVLALVGGTAARSAPADDASVQRDIETLVRESKARAAIVKRVSPAVVHIAVEKTVANDGEGGDQFDDEFFRRFFGPRMPVPPREFKQRGLGSGTIVDSNGYILTNNHVVEDADKITVKMQDGRELQGKLIGADPATDLAVVKIPADHLPVAKLGNSDTLEVGETVIAIGNPFGLDMTVTQGIVSAKGRTHVGLTDYEDFIQTDASINPGNSGGPLINLKGEIVGVNTAIFSRSGGSMGIGFSIPVNMARSIMHSLIESGRVVRGFLGVVIQDITQELADALGVKVNEGVLIANVGPNSPAAEGGIQQGDIVLKFNGQPVKNSNELRNAVAAIKPGTKVPVELLREGKPLKLRVAVGEQPKDMRAAIEGSKGEGEQAPAPERGGRPEEALGLQVEALTPDLAERLGYQGLSGVLISAVAPNSPASDAGLRRGTLVERVNRKAVHNVQEFRTEISKVPSGKPILLLARLGATNQFVVIKKP
ncbi:MAG TPA: DegQ family serine endoprotease [bacterium]|nr:DegQ family serine endoprotease [bacterium]